MSSNTNTESYASIHRKAVAESLRLELARAIDAIYAAKYVAVYNGAIYCYGTMMECEHFAHGIRGVSVRRITDKDQHELAIGKRRAYRGV